MTAGTTNFPASLDSHTSASPLGFGEVNNQAYTLSTASHTAAVTTITVASTSAFPSKGYLVIKREIVSYTGKTSTTFTGVTRGVGGTTAAAFGSGTLVEQVPVAANHNDLAAALVAVETKVGIGASTPIASSLLRGTAAGTSGWGVDGSGFGARKTTAQSINDTTFTAISFADSEYFDAVYSGDTAMHDLSTNPSRIYLRYAGLWLVVGCFGLNTTGCTTLARLYKNGTTSVPSMLWREDDAAGIGTNLLAVASFAAGDYVEIQAWHNKGVATNIGDYVGGTYVYVAYLGAI